MGTKRLLVGWVMLLSRQSTLKSVDGSVLRKGCFLIITDFVDGLDWMKSGHE